MFFLGIDIGTTGTKSILMDEMGHVLEHAYQGYGLISSDSGKVEQNPLDWWDAVKITVKACLKDHHYKNELRSIAVSAQGGSLVMLEEGGAISGNAISWLDGRAKVCRPFFLDAKGAGYYHERTGMILENGLAMQTIKWLQLYEPERYAKIRHFYTTLDFINYKLTGNAVIDPSCASLMQLLNVHESCWDQEILDLIGLDEAKLPRIVPAGTVVGHLTPETAAELELAESVEVVCGGLDQSCMALGVGAIHDGDMILSTGTAWVMLAITNHPEIKDHLDFCVIPHVIAGKWGFLASLPSAGASLDWLRSKLLGITETESYKMMDNQVALRDPGANGLLMYPFFSEYSAGQISRVIGLTLNHDRYDVLRAYMESIGYEIHKMIDALEQAGIQQENLKVAGGASRSGLWMNILSNILEIPIIIESNPDAACIGAARLAAIGAGAAKFADFGKSGGQIDHIYEPDAKTSALYQQLYANYLEN